MVRGRRDTADRLLYVGPPAGRDAPRSTPAPAAAIRAWARQNRHQVSDRGRISKTVVDAFQAAH